MRHLSNILFLLSATISSVALSHASTLTITDNLASGNPANHGTLQHWQQFSTTLSASVDKAPTPEQETTLGGVTYKWSLPSGGGVTSLTSTTGQSVGLQSSSGVELTPHGQNSIVVNCTAYYPEYDANNNFVKNLTVGPSSITVKFWSQIPVSVKVLDADPVRGTNPGHNYSSFTDNFYVYTTYSFRVLDNQSTAQYYGAGKIKEKFGTITANPDYAAALQQQRAPGDEAPAYGPTATFPDSNSWNTDINRYPNTAWPKSLVALTNQRGPSDFWYSLPQTFHCLEQAPGDPDYIRDTPLTPSFVVSYYRDYVERH